MLLQFKQMVENPRLKIGTIELNKDGKCEKINMAAPIGSEKMKACPDLIGVQVWENGYIY